MWQRIQTIWLFLASVVMTLFAFMPSYALLEVEGKGVAYLSAKGRHLIDPVMGGMELRADYVIMIISLLIALFAFASIFLFKKRLLQARIVTFVLLALVGELFYIAYLIWQALGELKATLGIKFALALPIVALPLLFMAIRRIYFDEALVRASNRIR